MDGLTKLSSFESFLPHARALKEKSSNSGGFSLWGHEGLHNILWQSIQQSEVDAARVAKKASKAYFKNIPFNVK